jgi:hypothetical protein
MGGRVCCWRLLRAGAARATLTCCPPALSHAAKLGRPGSCTRLIWRWNGQGAPRQPARVAHPDGRHLPGRPGLRVPPRPPAGAGVACARGGGCAGPARAAAARLRGAGRAGLGRAAAARERERGRRADAAAGAPSSGAAATAGMRGGGGCCRAPLCGGAQAGWRGRDNAGCSCSSGGVLSAAPCVSLRLVSRGISGSLARRKLPAPWWGAHPLLPARRPACAPRDIDHFCAPICDWSLQRAQPLEPGPAVVLGRKAGARGCRAPQQRPRLPAHLPGSTARPGSNVARIVGINHKWVRKVVRSCFGWADRRPKGCTTTGAHVSGMARHCTTRRDARRARACQGRHGRALRAL